MHHENVSIEDRLIAGALSALAMGVTAIAVPVVMLIVSRGRVFEFGNVFVGFHIWAISVVVLAGLLGICTGSKRAVELLGHLWGTAQPRNLGLTLLLWGVIVAIGLTSHWLARV